MANTFIVGTQLSLELEKSHMYKPNFTEEINRFHKKKKISQSEIL